MISVVSYSQIIASRKQIIASKKGTFAPHAPPTERQEGRLLPPVPLSGVPGYRVHLSAVRFVLVEAKVLVLSDFIYLLEISENIAS